MKPLNEYIQLIECDGTNVRLKDFIWLWKASKQVYIGRSINVLRKRLAFMLKAIKLSSSLQPFLNSVEGSLINKLILQRPETIGAIVWPYQCHTWDANFRLNRILEHYRVLENLPNKIDFPIMGALKLFALDEVYKELHIVLDQPSWFIREGQLVMNLFLGNLRIFSLAFSFAYESGKVVAYVGAMQGRNVDGLLHTYQEITKALYGMRPRDFLFELFRVFCRAIGVSKIYGVSNASRHHRGAYFGSKANKSEFTLNYDSIWLERGGVLDSPDFYVFDVGHHRKGLEEIPSKKRSMYRKRYEFLESIELRMLQVCADIDNKHILECPFENR